MTDQYLQEQHAYSMARAVRAEREQSRVCLDADEPASWVMLKENGDIVRLPHENIRHQTNSKISLELSVPKELQQGRTPFSLTSDSGTAYITNQRVIYIPAKPTQEFKSFHAPILNCEDTHIGSKWYGPWYWFAPTRPVSQGGIPPDLPRVDLKLSFNEGGHSVWRDKYEEQKERLEHIRRIERETGHTINLPDEPLPAYEARDETTTTATNLAPQPSFSRSASGASQNNRPSEPPPDYDEAQAQAISGRLEDHIRDESERA